MPPTAQNALGNITVGSSQINFAHQRLWITNRSTELKNGNNGDGLKVWWGGGGNYGWPWGEGEGDGSCRTNPNVTHVGCLTNVNWILKQNTIFKMWCLWDRSRGQWTIIVITESIHWITGDLDILIFSNMHFMRTNWQVAVISLKISIGTTLILLDIFAIVKLLIFKLIIQFSLRLRSPRRPCWIDLP